LEKYHVLRRPAAPGAGYEPAYIVATQEKWQPPPPEAGFWEDRSWYYFMVTTPDNRKRRLAQGPWRMTRTEATDYRVHLLETYWNDRVLVWEWSNGWRLL
jgi:hypothetical protein